MEAKSADDFILGRIDLSREAVYSAVQRIADSRDSPPATFSDVLAALERDGLVESEPRCLDALSAPSRRISLIDGN